MNEATIPALGRFAERLIHRKAKELIRRPGFSRSDREDVEQELRLHLLCRLRKFQPGITHINAFVATVIERRSASLIAHREAAMRTYRCQASSLNELVTDNDRQPIERGDTLPDDCHASRTGGSVRDDAQDLHCDVEAMIAALPPYLATICRRLQHQSVSEIAHSLGVPRHALYQALEELRSRFEQRNLDEYCRNVPTT